MAKDFFQDITPRENTGAPKRPAEAVPAPVVTSPSIESSGDMEKIPEKSIRNLNINVARPRPPERREQQTPGYVPAPPRKTFSLVWLWVAVAVVTIILIFFALTIFSSTSVSIVPRSQTVVFDKSKNYVAYPSTGASADALTYDLETFELTDSQSVISSGTSHVERKASASVTVINEFSNAPQRFVKTTRFETPDGLIFRAPVDIVVPGMKNGTPGTVTVTLVADQSGEKYNVGPFSKMTLPGLKGSASFGKVYARSSSAFSGGIVGEEPQVSASVKDTTMVALESRLRAKISEQLSTAKKDDSIRFPSLANVQFEELPTTAGDTNNASINMRARVSVPVFPEHKFTGALLSAVSADAENADISLVPKPQYDAVLVNASSTSYGSTPITFSLSGTALLVWNVDGAALAQALAGKNESAFQAIVNGFSAIQEARARIQPFWLHTFPSDPSKIKINVSDPVSGANP